MKPERARAAIKARDAAMNTPEEVRHAFIGSKKKTAMITNSPQKLSGITFEPFSLGMLYLLQEINHPFTRVSEPARDEQGALILDADKKPVLKEHPVNALDVSNAVYIFHDPVAARDALAEDRGVFDANAFKLSLTIPPANIAAIATTLAQLIAQGMETAPGGGSAGAGNPRGPARSRRSTITG